MSPEELIGLLESVWDAAQEAPYELREQVLDELLAEFGRRKKQTAVLTPDQFKFGQKVFHPLFGEGVVRQKDGERYVNFHNFSMELNPGWPWTLPVELL